MPVHESDLGVSKLETPVNLSSLLEDGRAEFAIKSSDILDGEEDTNVEKVYPLDKLEPLLLTQPDCSDDDEINLTHDFEKLGKRMTNVRADGKVMKKIDRPGAGDLIPDDDSDYIVYVHYAGYLEMADYPYDATRLRHKKPAKLHLHDLLLGLAAAIRSMRRGEKSKFLIHPDLAFRETGVPPRIPPDATLLFDVELFDFCLAEESNSNAAEQPQTCADMIAAARRCRESGNKRKMQEKNVNGAISQYHKGIYKLTNKTTMADEEEEEAVRCELIKLYTNLAVSYLAKEDFRRVCITYNDAMKECPTKAKKCVKLIYASAKALRFLGNYSDAKNRIRNAHKLKPGDKDILKEMTELEETIKRERRNESVFHRRMFGFSDAGETEETEEDMQEIFEEIGDSFKEQLNVILDNLCEDESRAFDRLDDFTLAERMYCRHVCKRRDLLYREHGSGGQKYITIHKKSM